MIKKCLTYVILAVICFGCGGRSQNNTPITWRQDEDEIILYMYFSSEASEELINLLDQPLTFEQVSDFLVQNSEGKVPFFEGAMVSAALTTGRVELQKEMETKRSQDGVTLQITGFKENPVKITKGALNLTKAPKTLAGFDSRKNSEIVNQMIDLMTGNGFVVDVYGRFPE